jgi:hypothetical protein
MISLPYDFPIFNYNCSYHGVGAGPATSLSGQFNGSLHILHICFFQITTPLKKEKTRIPSGFGRIIAILHSLQVKPAFFSHPDFNCRPWNLTRSCLNGSRAITADREFHPSPKKVFLIIFVNLYYHLSYKWSREAASRNALMAWFISRAPNIYDPDTSTLHPASIT